MQIAGVHGGGSPVMETIMMVGTYNIEKLKDIARYLAGIKKELPRTRREDLVKFL
jgi:4-hydroxyphenylacetate 3-monooxygenase/4-hydroxybutyryl-CoA dehydratase/vinylacetyl-CoA-Delta-isomerase